MADSTGDKKRQPKILAILGPTSSGKTKLAVNLARKFNGEIVSADSRQVYRGMDIGTGKDLKEYKVKSQKSKVKNIPYHLIDVVSTKVVFNLAKYQKLAIEAIDDILERKKLPILVGGTGLYLQAVIDGYALSTVKPEKKFRTELEKKSITELFFILKKINKKFAEKMNESDRKNKRRLIRYVEVAKSKWTVERVEILPEKKYKTLIIGLTFPKEKLNDRIYKRLVERLENEDMVGEVRRLHNEKLSWKKLESFGMEYKFISLYLQDKIDYDEMVERLFIAIRQFARRQMTWFRRWEKQGAKINWVKNKIEAQKIICNFLK